MSFEITCDQVQSKEEIDKLKNELNVIFKPEDSNFHYNRVHVISDDKKICYLYFKSLRDNGSQNFYKLTWEKRQKEDLIEQLSKGEEYCTLDIKLNKIPEQTTKDIIDCNGLQKILEYLKKRWEKDIKACQDNKENDELTNQWRQQKKDKEKALISLDPSKLGDIKHKQYLLNEQQTYQVKLARRVLKYGYSSLCMLDALTPYVTYEKLPSLNIIQQKLLEELQCLNDLAEAFCFNVVTKVASNTLDSESVYYYQQYSLAGTGWAKRISGWLWSHFSDVSELFGVAFEFASSGQGVEGNTNAQNFETLQAFIKNPERFEQDLKDGKVGYSEDHDSEEAKLAHYSDAGQLATSTRQMIKHFDTPKFVKSILSCFSLSEQLKTIRVSCNFSHTLASLKELDLLARNIGLHLKQAQSLVSDLPIEHPFLKATDYELLISTWKIASTTYLSALLPNDNEKLKPKEKLVKRRKIKRTRVKEKSILKQDNEAVYKQILAHEKRGMEWLNTSFKVKCYIPKNHDEEVTESLDRRLRLNRRL